MVIGKEGAQAKAVVIGLSNGFARSECRGRASIFVLAVLAVVGIAFLWRSAARERRGSVEPVPTLDAGTNDPGSSLAGSLRNDGGDAPLPTRGTTPERDLVLGGGNARTPSGEDARFRGRGQIRGHVEVTGSEPFPLVWRLVVRPSTMLIGRELAEERILEFTDGRQDFVVADLPLAGYDVMAEAAALNGLPQPVLLERRNENPFLNLRMIPAGFLEGTLVDDEGLPAEGVPVALLSLESEDETEEVRTDALGKFHFESVLDGPYLLVVGHPNAPILPKPRALRFQAPSMTLPPIELPPLATLDVQVTDVDQRGIPDVRVRGSGTRGGVFTGETDAYGAFRARHLPPGRYRIRIECAGYEGYRLTIELAAGEKRSLPLKMLSES